MEVGETEGDTLDPQTGLFYRSNQQAAEATKPPCQPTAQPAPSSQAEAEPSSASIQAPPPPPQLQSKPQLVQPSSSSPSVLPSTPPLTKKPPTLRVQSQPKPVVPALSPKDRLPAPAAAPAQPGMKPSSVAASTKPPLTPQLPRLQQAPTSHHRPLHTAMSHPPPLQAHHPVSTEKTPCSQVTRQEINS